MANRSATLTTWLLGKYGSAEHAIANDFADTAAPKLKFLFTVEFGFRGISPHKGSEDMAVIEYDLKTASRPNITTNYEDINFYNYRAKVATKIGFGTIKLSFYEDSINKVDDLIWQLLTAMSPITKNNFQDINTTNDTVIGTDDASGIGALKHTDGVIAWMKVHHHYVRNTSYQTTTYTCVNPKLETVEYDELDMSSSDASSVTLTFTIEGVTSNVTPGQYTSNLNPAIDIYQPQGETSTKVANTA